MSRDEADADAPLDAVRERREALVAAMTEVERVLAAPLRGRGQAWAGRLTAVLADLDGVLTHHVDATERPGGLLATVRAQAPRLDPLVRRLEAEHRTLRGLLDAAGAGLTDAGTDEGGLTAVREAVTDLLAALARHRQKGADLLYQAYDVDLGGGE